MSPTEMYTQITENIQLFFWPPRLTFQRIALKHSDLKCQLKTYTVEIARPGRLEVTEASNIDSTLDFEPLEIKLHKLGFKFTWHYLLL